MDCLGVVSVEELVTRGRIRWFVHGERKEKSDWVSACRKSKVECTKRKERGRKMLNECVKVDMKGLGWSRMMLLIEISGGV